jgi:hypothetical protein
MPDANDGPVPAELVDRVGAALLDHLLVCRQCFRVFVAQKVSIADNGCETGQRLTRLARERLTEPPKLAKKAHA